MDKRKLKIVLSNLDHWKDHVKVEDMKEPQVAAVGIVTVLTAIVNTYQYGAEEIEPLLKEAFNHLMVLATDHGRQIGREQEREKNPAIKSAGECVKVARDEERRALRTTLRTVFDAECERGTNPLYAFNEALKAVE